MESVPAGSLRTSGVYSVARPEVLRLRVGGHGVQTRNNFGLLKPRSESFTNKSLFTGLYGMFLPFYISNLWIVAMGELPDSIRSIGTDRRIWGVTVLFVGWTAFGMLTRFGLVLETATPLVYVYLSAVNAVVPGFLGNAPFWVGFVAFYFLVATALVGVFDWVQTRSVGARLGRRTTE